MNSYPTLAQREAQRRRELEIADRLVADYRLPDESSGDWYPRPIRERVADMVGDAAIFFMVRAVDEWVSNASAQALKRLHKTLPDTLDALWAMEDPSLNAAIASLRGVQRLAQRGQRPLRRSKTGAVCEALDRAILPFWFSLGRDVHQDHISWLNGHPKRPPRFWHRTDLFAYDLILAVAGEDAAQAVRQAMKARALTFSMSKRDRK